MPANNRPSMLQHLRRNWFAVEAIPMYVIIGGVVTGAAWYTYRLAMGPSVVWTKTNPTPWNTIQPNENIKLAAVNQKFDKSWIRERL
ncbi:putative nadh dehydrogenase [Lyophyllum shimeji]|uniref:Nadh dehydrogenase n=1 Tax=Lyophyllum shimeji TaxID=47721 RepID=A0A9P3PCV4_LYOSH|nr:putative nadh dehydrogenase [Lyophyllum shimeji]